MRALRIISLLALSIALVVFVFSCSDSGTNGNGNDDEGPSLTLTADSYNIIADGTSSTTVHATVKDSTGANVSDGTTVNFTTSLGTITPSATTSSGVANATLTSSSTAGTATVIATCGDVADTIQVEFREATASLTLTADSSSIVANGTSSTAVHATVTDSTGNFVANGTTVNFTTSLGTITPSATTSSGVANGTLTSSTTEGTATVIATCGVLADTIQVEFREASSGPDLFFLGGNLGIMTFSDGSFQLWISRLQGTTGADEATVTLNGTNVPLQTFISTEEDAFYVLNHIGYETEKAYSVVVNIGGETATCNLTTSGASFAKITAPVDESEYTPGEPLTIEWEYEGSGYPDSIDITVCDNYYGSEPDSEEYDYWTQISGTNTSHTIPGSLTEDLDGGLWIRIFIITDYWFFTGDIASIGSLVEQVFECDVVTVQEAGSGPVVADMELTADSYSMPADGASSTTINAYVEDTDGLYMPDGTTVNFSTSLGTITPSATTSYGTAEATLTSSSTPGTATIIATCGTVADTITVEFTEIMDVQITVGAGEYPQISWTPSDEKGYAMSISELNGVPRPRWTIASALGFSTPVTYGTVPTNATQAYPLGGASPSGMEIGTSYHITLVTAGDDTTFYTHTREE